jgi:hypothetical protein
VCTEEGHGALKKPESGNPSRAENPDGLLLEMERENDQPGKFAAFRNAFFTALGLPVNDKNPFL